jgi:O-antigen/teichoic acid export membrane protein
VGALLNATDHQTANTTFMGFTMATNVILNLVLIPHYGAVGASITAVVTNAFLFFTTLSWAKKIIKPSSIVIIIFLKALLAALIMCLVVWEMKKIIFWPLTIIIGALVYGTLLLAFRTIKVADIQLFLQLFKRSKQSIEEI